MIELFFSESKLNIEVYLQKTYIELLPRDYDDISQVAYVIGVRRLKITVQFPNHFQ